MLVQLFAVVGGLRSNKGIVVSDHLFGAQFSVLVVVSNTDQVLGLGFGVVESQRHDPFPHLLLVQLAVRVLVAVVWKK